MAATKVTPITGRSIQGERQARESAAIWASDDAVYDYVRNAPDKNLACRQRGRHTFEPANKASMKFTGVTPEGFMERRVVCDVCEKVGRIEEWDVQHRRGIITRCDLVRVRPDYFDRDYLGEKGRGRMKPRQIESAIGSLAMEGQDLRAIRKELIAEQQRADAERKRRIGEPS